MIADLKINGKNQYYIRPIKNIFIYVNNVLVATVYDRMFPIFHHVEKVERLEKDDIRIHIKV